MNISKTAIFALTIALSGLSIFAGSAVQTDAPGVQLRAAIEKEEVEGDLQAAIEQYKKIVADSGENRTVAASALLRLGGCYEKLGRDEARKTYERLVKDYADQSEQARAAQARLSALTLPSPTNLTTRRLDNPPADAPLGSVSPDGRYFSFWDWKTGDLAIRDLRTGEERLLTDEGTEGDANVEVSQQVEESKWSADSKYVAYAWYLSSKTGTHVELRVVGLEGGKPRVLSRYDRNSGEGLSRILGWSPDNRQILAVVTRRGGPRQMVLISSTNGSTRVLTDVRQTVYVEFACFSPDGRYIVFDRLPDEMFPERDLYRMSVDTGRITPLIRHSADDYLLGWSRDGQWLVFASDRTGALGLWVVGMSGAETEGEPQLIKPGIDRILPMGLTNQGALYYGVVRASEDLFVVDLDPETGKVSGSPRKAVERYEGGNFVPAYSPDGRYFAYISRRGNSPYPTNVGNALCIRSLETGRERVFYREIWRLGIRTIVGTRWSPDGRFISFGSRGGSSDRGIYSLKLENGEITRILQNSPDEQLWGSEYSTDQEHIISRINAKEGISQIVAVDVGTGTEREIYRHPVPDALQIRISPDRRRVAFINRGLVNGVRSLKIVPVSGGESKEIWSFGKDIRGGPILGHAWSPDGRYIIFSQPDPDGSTWNLWRISVEGGKPERMGLEKDLGIRPITVRPDGRELAYGGRGTYSTDSEIWAMENFLPQSTQEEGRGQ